MLKASINFFVVSLGRCAGVVCGFLCKQGMHEEAKNDSLMLNFKPKSNNTINK